MLNYITVSLLFVKQNKPVLTEIYDLYYT